MMAAPPPASIPCHRAVTGLAVFLAITQCAAAFLPHSGLWSVDHWGYVSRTLFLAAAACLLLVLSPWGGSLAIRSLAPLGRSLESRRTSRFVAGGLVALFALGFWLGRERTFFLSDGELLVRNIAAGTRTSFNADLLSYEFQKWAHLVLRRLEPHSLSASFRVVSIGSGIVWLSALFATVGRLSGRGWERILLGGLLATLGMTRLFYGYVETSPLLAAASAVYLWRSVVFLQTGQGLGLATLSLVVAVAMHATGVLLIPSYVLLLRQVRGPVRLRHVGAVAASLLLLLVLYVLIGRSAGRSGNWLSASADYFAKFVPLRGPLGLKQAYTLLSPTHLWQFVQQQLLLGPFALVALVVLFIAMCPSFRFSLASADSRPEGNLDDTIAFFLALQVIPMALMAFLYSRELGDARDWDLLGGSAPAALLLGLFLIRSRPAETRRLHRTTVLLIAVALFHLVPWVLVDTAPARSLARFESLLGDRMPLSRFARGYGYEEVGRYYLETGDLRAAGAWFEKAAALDPSDVKAVVPLAQLRLALGERERAIELYEEAIRLRPKYAPLYFGLGDAMAQSGKPAEASRAFRAALTLDPATAGAWRKLGDACFAAGDYLGADSAYASAMLNEPGSADLIYNRGLSRERLGDAAAAGQFYGRALELDPHHGAATFALGSLLLGQGRPADALPYLERVQRANPRSPQAINLAIALAYLGHCPEGRAVLDQISPVDSRLVHAYIDVAMISAEQGRREAALEILSAIESRDESLAKQNGVPDLIRRMKNPR